MVILCQMSSGMDAKLHIASDFSEVYESLTMSSIFERSAFDRLVEETDQEVALKILARFWVTLQESMELIHEGIRQDNGELIWKACHKVTGSAELVGFHKFGMQSRSLNATLKAMNAPDAHIGEINEYLKTGEQIVRMIESSFSDIKLYL